MYGIGRMGEDWYHARSVNEMPRALCLSGTIRSPPWEEPGFESPHPSLVVSKERSVNE